MNAIRPLKLVECPRDAMQGWPKNIPTEAKIRYLNVLLKAGFDTLDFGSFVSPKAIPQMADTAEVLDRLELGATKSRLLAIIANLRGAEMAVSRPQISYLGFPFSVSEEFQRRNANSTIEESLIRVEEIQALCVKNDKQLVVYISMGFGNPYGEAWDEEVVMKWVSRLAGMGIGTIALSDTIGIAQPSSISRLFSAVIPEFPHVEFGAHLHSRQETWQEKVDAAYESGCRRFDSAFKGIGGCPMAADSLVGNIATELLVNRFGGPEKAGLDPDAFFASLSASGELFHS